MAQRVRPDEQLRGKTLKVYLYMLKHDRITGPSEVQRKLGFSSASLASHHIDKLIDIGVVARNEDGSFSLVRKVDVGVLLPFINVGHLMLPRLGFYAGFFSGLTVLYLTIGAGKVIPYGLIMSVGSCLALWYESLRIWRTRPR